MLVERLRKKVKVRKKKKLYRTRVVRQRLLDKPDSLLFSGNDYLGLATHPKVVTAFAGAARQYGIGSTASPLLVGYHEPHYELENTLAEFLGFPKVLLFSCGYMANIGVISALCNRHDTVYSDRIAHASMLDAVKLSGAKLTRYPHVDMVRLETLLSKEVGSAFIVSEGVFGMDGEVAPVPVLSHLAREYDKPLLIDDAHGFGILGKGGRGVLSHFNLQTTSVDAYLATFGKAFGAYGAFVAGSEEMIDAMVQLARSYMFSTALPPAISASVCAGLQVLALEPERHAELAKRVSYFTECAKQLDLPVLPSRTPIQVFMVGDAHEAELLGNELKARGLMVSVIRPPTVPEGTSRLRISLNVSHTNADLDRLLSALVDLTVTCKSAVLCS